MKGHFIKKISIILTALSFLFCPFQGLSSTSFALSIEEEQAMGRQFVARIIQHYELVDDDFACNYINGLGQYLTRAVETKYFPFDFYIIKEQTVNAFAAPGGHVFIYSGLIVLMENVDELAGVLGHEIGHVSARHLSKRIKQSKTIGLATMAGILAGVLVGGPAAQALIVGSQAAGTQTRLNYSRDDERQADQLGFKYERTMGFDPEGMIGMLTILGKLHDTSPYNIPTYLLTHPPSPERIALVQSLLSNSPPRIHTKEADRYKALFPFFKIIIKAKCLEQHEAERLFKLDLKKSPESTLPHFGLGIVYQRMSEYSKSIYHLKKAHEGNPDFLPILTNLGKSYGMNGQGREAVETLEEALKQDDENSAALFLLALSYENMEQYQKAIRVYERLASFRPVKKEIYYHLGLSYGKENKLAYAHYNFGLYFQKQGQFKKAKFHFQKAIKLSKNNRPLKKKIEKEMGGKLPQKKESTPEHGKERGRNNIPGQAHRFRSGLFDLKAQKLQK